MKEVRVPKFGMSAVDVEILEVLVQPGDRVEVGTPVIEAGSDKVDFEIESEVAGIIVEVLVEPGQTCAMGAIVARVDQDDSAAMTE